MARSNSHSSSWRRSDPAKNDTKPSDNKGPKAVAVFKGGPVKFGVKPAPVKGPTTSASTKGITPRRPPMPKSEAPGRPGKPKPKLLTGGRHATNNAGNSGGSGQQNTAAAPFLTPVQQADLEKFLAGNSDAIGAEQRRISDATYDTNLGLYNNQRSHDVSTDDANQQMAARGLFQSSIRDGELNDLDATLAARNDILNTNLKRLTIDATSRMTSLGNDAGITQNMYDQLAVGNAQSITPIPGGLPGAGSPPAAGGGAGTGGTGAGRTVTQQTAFQQLPAAQAHIGANAMGAPLNTMVKNPVLPKPPAAGYSQNPLGGTRLKASRV